MWNLLRKDKNNMKSKIEYLKSGNETVTVYKYDDGNIRKYKSKLKNNIPMKVIIIDENTINKIKNTYMENWYLSLREIGRMYNVSHESVRKFCKGLERKTFESVYLK